MAHCLSLNLLWRNQRGATGSESPSQHFFESCVVVFLLDKINGRLIETIPRRACFDGVEFFFLQVSELKAALKAKGLSTAGLKAALTERLEMALDQ